MGQTLKPALRCRGVWCWKCSATAILLYLYRLCCYGGKTLGEQPTKKGKQGYADIIHVVCLTFMTYTLEMLKHLPGHLFHIDSYLREDTNVKVREIPWVVIAALGKFDKSVGNLVTLGDHWIYLIKNASTMDWDECQAFLKSLESIEGGQHVAEALYNLAELSEDPAYDSMRYAIEREQHRQADLVYFAEVKGEEAKEKRNIAQQLLHEGFEQAQVSKLTGLDMSQVAELVSQTK